MTASVRTIFRQINVQLLEHVLRDTPLAAGRYYDGRTAMRRDAIGELAHAAGIPDALLTRIDRHSQGRPVDGYDTDQFTADCRLLDEALRARYGILPEDRNALCFANDRTQSPGVRWVSVISAARARNELLATGQRPDESRPVARTAGAR